MIRTVTMIKIPVDGPPVETEGLPSSFTLEELQAAVDGPIQQVPHFDWWYASKDGAPMQPQHCVAYCDEEGKLKGKPRNDRATLLWSLDYPGVLRDYLVGDVAILIGDPRDLEDL